MQLVEKGFYNITVLLKSSRYYSYLDYLNKLVDSTLTRKQGLQEWKSYSKLHT